MRQFLWMVPVIAIGILAIPSSCARDMRSPLPPIGKTMTILPSIVNGKESPKASFSKTQAIHFTFIWGGRPIREAKGNPTINFFGSDDAKPVASIPWSEFSQAYKNTGCTNAMLESLEKDLDGVTLVCNGSIDIDSMTRIVIQEEGGKSREATSWASYTKSGDVMAVVVQTY